MASGERCVGHRHDQVDGRPELFFEPEQALSLVEADEDTLLLLCACVLVEQEAPTITNDNAR